MAWNYSSREELEADGYKFQNSARCRGANCKAMIDWYRTPRNKLIPINPDTLEPHWGSCVDHKEFRE